MERARILSGSCRVGGASLAMLLSGLACMGALAFVTGCDTTSLADPTELGARHSETLVMPILSAVDPAVEGANDQYAQAVAPTPADGVVTAGDYEISHNDLVEITVADLTAPGSDTFRRLRVSETGNINLPYLGEVKAEGLTEAQLTQVIGDDYKAQGYLNHANVTVQVVEARGRAFSIVGAVNGPGEYAITQSDYRIWDALVTARNTVSPLIEYAYVIRKIKPGDTGSPTTEPGMTPSTGPAVAPATGPSNEELVPHTDAGNVANQPMNVLADPPAPAPSNNPLIDLAESSTQPTTQPTSTPGAPTPITGVTEATTESNGGGFEFNSPETVNYRIIRVPLQKLRDGDLSANIVVRPHDLIVVQDLPVGNYYMEGHIARPGAYTLSGSKVTLRQAIGAAAGLDALAIPQHSELVRVIKPNTMLTARIDVAKIFNGEEPDIYLKPDDQILVGTNAIAPFLAALRGAFRITYGFGFLYDRNFEVPNSQNQ